MDLYQVFERRDLDLETIQVIYEEVDQGSLNQIEDGKSPLLVGFQNDVMTVEMLKILESKVVFTQMDSMQRNFLHYHIIHSKQPSVEMLRYLIDKGITLQQQDKMGRDCLDYLVLKDNYEGTDEGMLELVDLTLQRDEFIIDERQITVMEHLCGSKLNAKLRLEIMKRLMEKGFEMAKVGIKIFQKACLNPDISLEELKYLTEIVRINDDLDHSGKNVLHHYCENTHPKKEILQFFLDERKMDPTKLDSKNKSLFHYICNNQNSTRDIFDLLFSYNVDFNVVDQDSECAPIHISCMNKNVYFVEQFLLKKVDVNLKGPFSKTPLVITCEKEGSYELIKLLLDHGANEIDFALQVSCQKEIPDVSVVKLLCERGGNARVNNFFGKSLLHVVCSTTFSNLELVQYLVEAGVSVNSLDSNKRTCVFYACQSTSNFEVLKFLLGKLDNMKEVDVFDQNLLHAICMNDKASNEAFKLILEQGFDINQQDNNHKSALHFLCESKKENYEHIKLLLEHKPNVNILNSHGKAPLHDVIQKPLADFDVVKLLVSHKADVNIQEKSKGQTILHMSIIQSPNYKTIKHLLENNAIPNIMDNTKCTPLHYFVGVEGLENEISLLLSSGAEPPPKFLNHYCRTHNLKMVELFLIHNCNLKYKDGEGNSAKDIAKQSNFTKGIKLIEEYESKGTLWVPEKHYLFPQPFKSRVFAFVCSSKIYFSSRKHLKIPKPLLFIVVQLSSVPNHFIFHFNQISLNLDSFSNNPFFSGSLEPLNLSPKKPSSFKKGFSKKKNSSKHRERSFSPSPSPPSTPPNTFEFNFSFSEEGSDLGSIPTFDFGSPFKTTSFTGELFQENNTRAFEITNNNTTQPFSFSLCVDEGKKEEEAKIENN